MTQKLQILRLIGGVHRWSGRHLGRLSVDISVDVSARGRSCGGWVEAECRSSVFTAEVSTDHQSTVGGQLHRRSVAIVSIVCRQYIGNASVVYQSSISTACTTLSQGMCRPIVGGHYWSIHRSILSRHLGRKQSPKRVDSKLTVKNANYFIAKQGTSCTT